MTEADNNVVDTLDTAFSHTLKAILESDNAAKLKLQSLKKKQDSVIETVSEMLDDYRSRQMTEADRQISAYKKKLDEKINADIARLDNEKTDRLKYFDDVADNYRSQWIETAVSNIKL